MRHRNGAKRFRTAALSAALAAALTGGARAQGLTEKIIAHVPTVVTSLYVNDSGWVVWTTGRGSGSQVYVWNRVSATPLGMTNGNNRDAQINNNNWVVWDGNSATNSDTDAFVWRGAGTYADLSSAYPSAGYPVVNNLNDIAWGGLGTGANSGIYDIYYISHTGTSVANLTVRDDTGGSTNPMLNDVGGLTWTRQTGVDATGASNLVSATVTTANTFTSLTNSTDLNVYQAVHGLNNSGAVVWRQYNNAKTKWDIWKYAPNSGAATDLSINQTGNSYEPFISDSGIVAWHTDYATASSLFWDKNDGKGAVKIPLSQGHAFNRPVAINTAGSVAYASGDGSGTGFDIILAEAPPARTVSGGVTITNVSNIQQPMNFTFRPANGAAFTRTVTLAANGGFSLPNIPAQSYTVHIKGALCLAKNITVDATNGDVGNISATLESGDANNDNSCDTSDFGLLVGCYGASASAAGSGYDPNCDFNFDGFVDASDFSLLVGSYGDMGDN